RPPAAAADAARARAARARPARRGLRAADRPGRAQPRSGRGAEGVAGPSARRPGRARGRTARAARRRGGAPLKTVFAVDGGGSTTDAVLMQEDGAVLGFARGPLSHPHHIGVAASADVIDALAVEVGAPADLAVLLLAGLDFPDEEETYRAEAEHRGWAPEVVVGNDTFAVLRAGSERGWGVAVTC